MHASRRPAGSLGALAPVVSTGGTLVVVKWVNKPAKVLRVAKGLSALQAIVGGMIEYVAVPGKEFFLYANEDGLYQRLLPNVQVQGGVIVGTVVATKSDKMGNDVGFKTEREAQAAAKYLDTLAHPNPRPY
jgi:hypothetical protein